MRSSVANPSCRIAADHGPACTQKNFADVGRIVRVVVAEDTSPCALRLLTMPEGDVSVTTKSPRLVGGMEACIVTCSTRIDELMTEERVISAGV